MKIEEILAAASMPASSPSYPFGPYRFVNREFFVISYLTDPEEIRRILPEPLEPLADSVVHYEWIRMPDSQGFGNYTESGLVIPATFHGEPVSFVAEMFLDDMSPIAAGREIWGFPKEYAEVNLEVKTDTLVGTLSYCGERVAMGTMAYKYHECDKDEMAESIKRTQILLKLIPDVDGTPAIAQLVSVNLEEVVVKGAWSGPARLHVIPHVQTKFPDLPVKKVLYGKHYISDLTLPYGKVVHDYLK